MKDITGFFPSLDIWTGDPCLPFAYNWLTCTNDTRPYISIISLAENKLNGSIPDLSSLIYLEILDLQNNSLTGPIPDFLGGLPALTTLNLDNNNLSGQIPKSLLDKIATSGLKLRDVKSSNILLGKQFEGKISDFGISKSRQYDTSRMTGNSQVYTVVQGSFGYLDPVYAETNIATHSIDVYAFGVVLFELVSGKPPMIQATTRMGEFLHIVQWAKPQIERGNLSNLIDPHLSDDRNVSSVWKVVDIAMMCVDHDRKKRPTMREVKLELQSALSMELRAAFMITQIR
ncbi:hypothetical protein KP509_26G070500 [Ceratopteris richardii]|nr:hypothetical protein KP509_26G070500 [Ceratopteris richardii]KAH7297454.1 hypothetical protein KP509_26G070500 [Ceratopteris richardii]KAH7297455.1 hypothetical protein KP509_26G070500 [Ceratopteris richardii]